MRFLVETAFTQAPTPEILALIPAESARGVELDQQGVRQALYVAADQSRAWQVLTGLTEVELNDVLESFPLHPYVRHTITPLSE